MAKSQSLTILATSAATQNTITIAASSLSVKAGQSVTISGTYTDPNGNGISGATLYLFVNGVQQGSFQTGSAGTYSFPVTFQTAGNYTVDVSDNTSNQ